MTAKWIEDYAQDCRILLGVGDEWHITIAMTDAPDRNPKSGGAVSLDTQYLNAVIELNHKCFSEEDTAAHQIILHEMMHVSLANYRMIIDQIFTNLPENIQGMAAIMVSQAEEQYIQRTSRALLRTIKPAHIRRAEL